MACTRPTMVGDAIDMTFVAAHSCKVQSSAARHVSLSFLRSRQVEVISACQTFQS